MGLKQSVVRSPTFGHYVKETRNVSDRKKKKKKKTGNVRKRNFHVRIISKKKNGFDLLQEREVMQRGYVAFSDWPVSRGRERHWRKQVERGDLKKYRASAESSREWEFLFLFRSHNETHTEKGSEKIRENFQKLEFQGFRWGEGKWENESESCSRCSFSSSLLHLPSSCFALPMMLTTRYVLSFLYFGVGLDLCFLNLRFWFVNALVSFRSSTSRSTRISKAVGLYPTRMTTKVNWLYSFLYVFCILQISVIFIFIFLFF